jgi:hypothetical protein
MPPLPHLRHQILRLHVLMSRRLDRTRAITGLPVKFLNTAQRVATRVFEHASCITMAMPDCKNRLASPDAQGRPRTT